MDDEWWSTCIYVRGPGDFKDFLTYKLLHLCRLVCNGSMGTGPSNQTRDGPIHRQPKNVNATCLGQAGQNVNATWYWSFISDHGSVEHHARRFFTLFFSLFSHRENIPRTVFGHYALTHCAGMAFSRYFHSVADTGFISIAPAACDHSANNHLVNTVYQHVEFGDNPE